MQPKGGKAAHARSGQALPSINPATAATLAERLPVGAVCVNTGDAQSPMTSMNALSRKRIADALPTHSLWLSSLMPVPELAGLFVTGNAVARRIGRVEGAGDVCIELGLVDFPQRSQLLDRTGLGPVATQIGDRP